MAENVVPSGLTEKDEFLHPPTNENKWRESYYFNWVDLTNNISGFSTIGLLPNEKRREFVFLLFMKSKNETYYREPELLNYSNDVNEMLKDKRLIYRLVKPFKIWELNYVTRKFKFEIIFEARYPTYNFGVGTSSSWHQHFETSGNIRGKVKFQNGEQIVLNGYGQRDKSWGFRDWHQFEKWYAGHFQFKDWSATFREDYYGDNVALSGHTSNKNGNYPITKMKVDTITDSDQFKSPISAVYEFENNDGNTFHIKSKRISKRSYIRFVREFPGGYTELFEQMVIMEDVNTGEIGSGMMEHLRTSHIL